MNIRGAKRARRRAPGWIAICVGCTLVVVTALAGHSSAAGRADPPVWLAISLSDASSGQFASGSPATVTAAVTNQSTTTTGVDVSGTTTTATISATAHPTVTLSYPTALSFSTEGSGWSCNSAAAGVEGCTMSSSSGLLSPGSSATLPVIFSVVGGPGAPASVTASVNGNDAEPNQNPSATATDSASVVNPDTYTKDVPGGSFPQKVGSDQVVSGATQAYSFTDGPSTIIVHIPPGAVPDGTHLAIYRANPTFWSASASGSTQSFLDGYAAACTASGATTPADALFPVTMTLSDPAILSGDVLYRATTTGIGPPAATATGGAWSTSFTVDPGFVLLRQSGASSTGTTTGTNSAGTTTGTSPNATSTGVTRTAGPNLTITSLHVSPAKHKRLSLTATTKNVGARAAGPSSTAFYLQRIKGRRRTRKLGARAVGTLAPGASSTQHLRKRLPRKVAARRYRAIACANARRSVAETSTADNCTMSDMVVTVHKRKHHRPIFTLSSSPAGPRLAAMLIPQFPGAPGRRIPIMLMLLGVFSILSGIIVVGLRRRTPAAALQLADATPPH